MFTRWSLLLVVGALAIAGWFGYSNARTSARLEAAEADLIREAMEQAQLVDAIRATADSNARVRTRLDRTLSLLEDLRNEPVTASCGPSVHRAIDSMREDPG